MKSIFTLLALALASALSFPEPMNDDGHQLTALWAQYEEARKADRPQKEAEILSQIKKEAMDRRLPVDFYDAATKYVSTVERRDWKQREPALKTLAEEVESFDFPIVTVLWMDEYQHAPSDRQWAYVKEHLEGFQGKNTPFYRGIGSFLGGNLGGFVGSDKEYVLWRLLQRRSFVHIENDEVYQALAAEVKGTYPNEPALEYYALNARFRYSVDDSVREKALQELAAKYQGRSVSVYPRADILRNRFSRMVKEKASGEAFRQLYEECEAFEAERTAFKGDDATIVKGCTHVKSLCETLTAASIGVRANRQEVCLTFKNLKKADVTLYRGFSTDGKKLRTWKAENPAGSFFVADTLLLPMPSLPDGDYLVLAESGDHTDRASYRQYTLSIATRADADGRKVYVTDYITGEPLKKVKLRLLRGEKTVASSTVAINGFTPLPKAMQKAIDKNPKAYFSLVAEQGNRLSQEVSARDYYYTWDGGGFHCNLYRDRGAYNPGDTLQFKAVMYDGDPKKSFSACKQKELSVKLYDSENNELEEKKLTTNEFGSISGSFALPGGLRNGYFSIVVRYGNTRLASARFRVDEFVLPTFDLSFDKQEQLFLVGDKIPVSGKLTAYSGHNLSGASISAKVSRWGDVVFEETVPVQEDNTFSFAYPTWNPGMYTTEVMVTEATGEMRNFFFTQYVSDRIHVSASIRNAADGDYSLLESRQGDPVRGRSEGSFIIHDNVLKVFLEVDDADGDKVPVPLEYALLRDGKEIRTGKAESGETVEIDLSDMASGLYAFRASATVPLKDKEPLEDSAVCHILLSRSSETVLPDGVKRFFEAGPLTVDGGPVSVRMASGEGPAWIVATLYGEDRTVLASRTFQFGQGSIGEISFDYAAAYPDAVRMQVFYFISGEAVSYERQYRRAKDRLSLPLRFTRFHDSAYPGTQYTFSLETDPGVEVLAAAWDKSLDAIASNYWPTVSLWDYSVPSVIVSSVCGHVTGKDGEDPVFYRLETRALAKGAGAVNAEMEEAMPLAAAPPEMMDSMVNRESADDDSGAPVPAVRSDFSSVLTFQPHLRPLSDGTLDFTFRTSDKLSTYYVAVYAHDPTLRNALLQQEMVVSLPVKVDLLKPQFLYGGDRYQAAVTVSSISDEAVSGVLKLSYGGSSQQIPVTVEPGKTLSNRFLVVVPSGVDQLELTASFVADAFTDAVRVQVPVHAAAQTLTEAHSAVLLSGADREALLKDLRSRFVNVPGADASLKEITVLDMVRDAIPGKVDPSGRDVLSLTEALYVRLLAGRLNAADSSASLADAPEAVPSVATEDLKKQIMACRNSDGGFGWFEGMSSSAIITAVVLERFAKLRDRGFEVPDVKSAVKFLDKNQFGVSFPLWRGWVSDAQYMHVRSLYPEVPFQVKPVTKDDKKRMAEFQKYAKSYLVPSKNEGRGLQGQILAKARRLLTLKNLFASGEGVALAEAWGITGKARTQIQGSLQADIASLLEYAVEHRDGGWYYPNAVMPWRGLMESEAYAHALLCDLLSGVVEDGNTSAYSHIEQARAISNGIRLWLMLQKETQKWETDPAYVDAITSILDGPKEVLDTRVLALSATYEAPFSVIKAAGNGFTIDRKFYRTVTEEQIYDDKTGGRNAMLSGLQEIRPGDPVKVGEKIVAKYQIWNGENRSFVKVDAGREAALRPVQQLSGHVGGGFIVPFGGRSFGFGPQGYRNVKADRTEYFFDSYPEEKTTLTEEFFVTQAGEFVAPVLVIESLYAPHYRANSASRGVLESLGQ